VLRDYSSQCNAENLDISWGRAGKNIRPASRDTNVYILEEKLAFNLIILVGQITQIYMSILSTNILIPRKILSKFYDT
jgi:hypothetical protein